MPSSLPRADRSRGPSERRRPRWPPAHISDARSSANAATCGRCGNVLRGQPAAPRVPRSSSQPCRAGSVVLPGPSPGRPVSRYAVAPKWCASSLQNSSLVVAGAADVSMVASVPVAGCCWRALVTVVDQDVAYMAVLAGADLQCQRAARLKPELAEALSQRQQTQAGAVAVLGMLVLLHQSRHRLGGSR